ncbi:MAG: phytoene/squalene synthase family protein [Chloroflexi bacterium]|nr:MAG: phytoene/squalene synthase family protein [Chloroflexota bacterium]
MFLSSDAKKVLKATSRTFYIPISRLPAGLQEAIGSAYLCMRAIDEIEDHPNLEGAQKAELLNKVSWILQSQTFVDSFSNDAFDVAFRPYAANLPEVTLGLAKWASQAPASIAPRVWDATAAMANRMAFWSLNNWQISTVADLDHYTFSVAGAVGLLICDVGGWFDGLQMHRGFAIQFGRGLQLVNILRNRSEDLRRGVDFFPHGWSADRMHAYARKNLVDAEAYAKELPGSSFSYFLRIPLVLALATLDALARGEQKLSRATVIQLVRSV